MSSNTKLPILVVDDDAPTQMLLEALLRRYGHATELAVNGADAVARLRDGEYSLIILDLMMPHVSGLDVIAALRGRARRIPVIICTAAGPAQTAILDRDLVDAVVRKPFEITELAEIVSRLIDGGSLPAPSVLVVDDDPRARYILRSYLEPRAVREAETGDAALASILESRPDIVILDLLLPGMPGEDVLRRLRDTVSTRDLPVVIVTSRKLDDEERSRLLEHASAVIYKGDLSRETLEEALMSIKAR